VTLGGPAKAKIVGSGFDPTFFDGIAHFFVPDVPCLGLSTGFHEVNPGSEGCSGVVLLDASVNVDDHSGDTAHLLLPPPTPFADAVTGIVIDPTSQSTVVGVNTRGVGDPHLIELSIDNCTGTFCSSNWFIQWDSGLPVFLEYSTHLALEDWNPLDGLDNQVFLYQQLCPDGPTTCGAIEPFFDPAIHVEFTPEPGSLALLLGALGAGWLARRRKIAR